MELFNDAGAEQNRKFLKTVNDKIKNGIIKTYGELYDELGIICDPDLVCLPLSKSYRV